MKIFKLARRILGLVTWDNFEVSQNKCILLEIIVLWNCLCGSRRGNSNISLVIFLYFYHINEYIKWVLFCFSLTKKTHNWEEFKTAWRRNEGAAMKGEGTPQKIYFSKDFKRNKFVLSHRCQPLSS